MPSQALGHSCVGVGRVMSEFRRDFIRKKRDSGYGMSWQSNVRRIMKSSDHSAKSEVQCATLL